MVRLLAHATCCGLLLPMAVLGQETTNPPRLDAGPLLAFVTIDGDGDERQTALHIAELEGKRVFEFPCDRRPPQILRRLDRDHLLLERREPERLVVLAPATGAERVLVTGSATFVGVRADEVLFLAAPGRDGHFCAVPWQRPGERRQLTEHALEQVPVIAGNLALAIALDRKSVLRCSLASGRSKRLWTAPDGAHALRLALSPGGNRLAIGHVDRTGTGTLQVLDVATGTLLNTFADLPIFVSPLSSSMPTLEIAFAADDRIACSESRGKPRAVLGEFVCVVRDVATGEIVAEESQGELGLRHPVPLSTPRSDRESRFTIRPTAAGTELRAVGKPEPLLVLERRYQQYQDVELCPIDPRFAAARSGRSKRVLLLFTADTDTPRRLSSAWAFRLRWLPAAR